MLVRAHGELVTPVGRTPTGLKHLSAAKCSVTQHSYKLRAPFSPPLIPVATSGCEQGANLEEKMPVYLRDNHFPSQITV